MMNIYECRDEDRCSSAFVVAEDIKTAIELYTREKGFYPFTIDTMSMGDSIVLIQEKKKDTFELTNTIDDINNKSETLKTIPKSKLEESIDTHMENPGLVVNTSTIHLKVDDLISY